MSTATAIMPATSADVREWAATKGYPIKEKGRLGVNVVDEYNRTHRTRPYVPRRVRGAKPPETNPDTGNGKIENVEVKNGMVMIPVKIEDVKAATGEAVTATIRGEITFRTPSA